MTHRRKEVIGDCTLYLGDCMGIVPDIGTADAIVTDPPYGMSFQSNHRRIKHSKIANDKQGDLLIWACSLPASHSKYVFCRWNNLAYVPPPKSCITWIKNNWSMGDLKHEHARQTEICLFYDGPRHFFPNERPSDIITVARTGNDHHPTEKPCQLMAAIIRWTSGAVLDPFMGSGTTGVACAKMGRKFIGIELEPKYFDIACKRIDDAYKQGDLFVPQGGDAVGNQEDFDLDGGVS